MTLTLSAPLPDLNDLRRQRDRLMARADEADRQFTQLGEATGVAKARIEDDPEVAGVLEDLQTLEHQRAVGDYEQLLTLLLQDVLPGPRQVVLDLRTERGLPALDVYLRKGEDQPLEDALHGTGGSVTNLLSAGLRFIALMRSGLRPFLVLDEADCWIKPALAAKFAGVVQQMAEELGVQVLMISHHDDSLFEPVLPHRLRLESGANGLSAHWAPSAQAPEWQEDQEGLRSIELHDFQSHRHTVLPLSPGVTLLQGDNDIGKSAVAKALRSVFYAESNDTFIRHGAKSARVAIDFGPGNILAWERNRKGKVKVAYSLVDRGDGQIIHHSEGAREVPAWVEAFGIRMADDLDIQLGDQHDPVFLLNKRPSERAKALAVGDDAGHVQAMLSLSKQELNEARATVRQGEKQLETLYRIRAALAPVRESQEAWTQAESLCQQINNTRDRQRRSEQVLDAWQGARVLTENLVSLEAMQPPVLPILKSSPQADTLLWRWNDARHSLLAREALDDAATVLLPAEPLSPKLEDVAERWKRTQAQAIALSPSGEITIAQMPQPSATLAKAQDLLLRWQPAREIGRALELITTTDQISVPAAAQPDHAQLQERWKRASEGCDQLQSILDNDLSGLAAVEQELSEAFDHCPTCLQPLPKGHQH